MGNVSGRKAEYDVTNAKSEAPVEGGGQIKAVVSMMLHSHLVHFPYLFDVKSEYLLHINLGSPLFRIDLDQKKKSRLALQS